MGEVKDAEVEIHRNLIAQQLQDVINRAHQPNDHVLEQHQTAIGFLIHKIAELHVELVEAQNKIDELDRRTVGQTRLG